MSDVASSRGALWGLRVFFVVLVLFLYLPLTVLVIFSFNSGDVTFPLEHFTTSWYSLAWRNPALLEALGRSALVAVVASTITVVLGVLASYALVRRSFWGKPAFAALVFFVLLVVWILMALFGRFTQVRAVQP